MPSKKPQFNRRLPEETLAGISLLAQQWGCSEAEVVAKLVEQAQPHYHPKFSCDANNLTKALADLKKAGFERSEKYSFDVPLENGEKLRVYK
jgi:hypothetical protein